MAAGSEATLATGSGDQNTDVRPAPEASTENPVPIPEEAAGIEDIKRTDTTATMANYPTGLSLWTIFAALFFAALCVGLDRSILTTAIPKITSEFDSLGDVGWYGSAYLLTTCCFQLLFGKLYAEFSIKWIFLLALAIFEIGSVICAAAPSSIALILGRAIAGLGGAGLIPGALIILARSVPLHQRPKWTGAIGGAVGAAQVIAPTLGGVFTDKVTWRWCFWINLPLGGITFFGILFLVRLPADPSAKGRATLNEFLQKFDLLGTILLMPWVVCLLLALQWGGVTYAWSSWRIILLLVLFAVLFVAWAALQIKEGDRATVPGRIVAQRTMASGVWFMFTMFANSFIIIYYIPIWFQTVRNYSAYQSGINFLTMSAAMSLTVIFSGIMTGRIGYFVPGMILSGVLTPIAAGFIYTFDVHTSDGKWIGILILLGIGLGFGMQQPLMAAQTVFRGHDISLSTSVLIFTQTLAGTIFVSVAENIFQTAVVKNLRRIVPSVDPAVVLGTGASQLNKVMGEKYPNQLRGIIEAYNKGLQQAFLIALILSCLAIFGVLGVEWVSTKKDKQADKENAKKAEEGKGKIDTKEDPEKAEDTANDGEGTE